MDKLEPDRDLQYPDGFRGTRDRWRHARNGTVPVQGRLVLRAWGRVSVERPADSYEPVQLTRFPRSTTECAYRSYPTTTGSGPPSAPAGRCLEASRSISPIRTSGYRTHRSTSLRCPAIRLLTALVTLAPSTRTLTFFLWQWFIAGARRSRHRWSNRSSPNKPAGAGRGARAGGGRRPLHDHMRTGK